MMAVNLGTAGAKEAAELLEYCNLPTGTSIADQRAANGHPEPYGVKLWCLGNEMDAPWQAGHVSAATYAERAAAAGSLMKGLDPTIETVACGSQHQLACRPTPSGTASSSRSAGTTSTTSPPTTTAATTTTTPRPSSPQGVELDAIITQYRGLLDHVSALKRSFHRVHVSFDEWNVWYREMPTRGDFQEAPHLLEETYNLQDALVCAQYLHAFLRHADIVKVACIAQIVNVIAPILTRPDGLLVQSIYWPFRMLRDAATGDALRVAVRAPEMKTTAPRRRPRPRRRRHLRRDDRQRIGVHRQPRRGQARRRAPAHRRSRHDRHLRHRAPRAPQSPERLGLPRHDRPHRPPRDHPRRRHPRFRLPAPAHAVLQLTTTDAYRSRSTWPGH